MVVAVSFCSSEEVLDPTTLSAYFLSLAGKVLTVCLHGRSTLNFVKGLPFVAASRGGTPGRAARRAGGEAGGGGNVGTGPVSRLRGPFRRPQVALG